MSWTVIYYYNVQCRKTLSDWNVWPVVSLFSDSERRRVGSWQNGTISQPTTGSALTQPTQYKKRRTCADIWGRLRHQENVGNILSLTTWALAYIALYRLTTQPRLREIQYEPEPNIARQYLGIRRVGQAFMPMFLWRESFKVIWFLWRDSVDKISAVPFVIVLNLVKWS